MKKYRLKNENGLSLEMLEQGGIVTSIKVPDRNGVPGDVVLGLDDIRNYTENSPKFGAILGRYAGRISGGHYTLDKKSYALSHNATPDSIHGGRIGFDKLIWEVCPLSESELKLTLYSPHGEEGHPGNLQVEVHYSLTNDQAFRIYYRATVDQSTHLNLTHQSYFNLSAGLTPDILQHELMLKAEEVVMTNSDQIPTGNLGKVTGTAMDFLKPRPIIEGGHDETYVLDSPSLNEPAATLYDPFSGRFLEVFTTEPGIHFYTGNALSNTIRGKGRHPYRPYAGLTLATQHFADSPNQPHFPSTRLDPGQVFESTTIYRFSTR